MRTYGRRYINQQVKGIADQSLEIQNGVIWSVDTTEFKCNIKILGTTDLLEAFFPPSYQSIPSWVQQGSPVYLRDRKGQRNALEIVGPGHVLMAPSTGTTDDYSPVQQSTNLSDRILSGCAITEIPLEPQMCAMVHSGYVRIDGSTIEVPAIKMDSTVFKMDMGGRFNDVAAIIDVTTATTVADDMRYDLFSSDTAGAITYSVGTTFPRTQTTETLTTLSDWEIQLGKMIVPANTTIIRDNLIQRDWASAVPNDLRVTITVGTSSISTIMLATSMNASLKIEVLDQYNNTFIKEENLGWRLELNFAGTAKGYLQGSGSITTSTSIVYAHTGASAGYPFLYQKPSGTPGSTLNVSPIFRARLADFDITKYISITNLTTLGVPLTSANN